MNDRIVRRALLDVATAGLVVVALAAVVHDRVLPAIAERARIDPGDRLRDDLRFRPVGTGDTLSVTEDETSLVVVFRSTCPVCEETAPDWAALTRIAGHRVFAVGLEADSTAAAWVSSRVPGVHAVVPLDPSRFLDRLRIRAVPTTLLFEGRRLALARVGPLQSQDRERIRRAFASRRIAGFVQVRSSTKRRTP